MIGCPLLRLSGAAVVAVLCSFVSAPAVEGSKPESPHKIDFLADIRPIFAQNCLICHGEDKQESSYRLDRKAIALKGGELGEAPILPGKGKDSPLVRYISGADDSVVMPPKGRRLTAEQVALVRAWIDQGADWPDTADAESRPVTRHWSFQQVRKIEPPALSDPFVANPIDAFVLAKLRENGLLPSLPADPVTLVRRLYLDLHGLPPTPEKIQGFLAECGLDNASWKRGTWGSDAAAVRPGPKAQAAISALVNRLLASPRYGERWARHWLDIVRFAETNGFEMNNERPNAWRYRDYVIDSFNSDKPYDRFVTEQLAGDAVGADAATGFLVGGPWDQVKSPDPVLTTMQRTDELADMTNTTGTTFLGLTVGCARCHNHKFDPILQKDYYSMQAVFAGVQHGERAMRDPATADETTRLAAAKERLKVIATELAKIKTAAHIMQSTLLPAVNSRENDEHFAAIKAKYVRFTCLATNSGSQPCIDELEIYNAAPAGGESRNVALASHGAKATSSGNYPKDPRHKLAHLNDGRYGNSNSWISDTAGTGWVQIELDKAITINRIVWGRDREERFNDRTATDYVVQAALEPGKWQDVASSKDRAKYDPAAPDSEQRWIETLPKAAAGQARLLYAERKALQSPPANSAQERLAYAGRFEQPPEMHRLYRGDPLQPREAVAPDCLSVIGTLGLPKDAPEQQRRLKLARWIASSENPLTARVIVNRLWQHHFGTGLVDTPSDFGASGSKPTHPELLDWLAGQLVAKGWSLKEIHRLILLSSTYQQSDGVESLEASAPKPSGKDKGKRSPQEIDAQSRLLWRFPPRRMEAEVLRDSILAVTGKLDLTMGGPGWSTFKPNSNYVRFYDPKDVFGPAEWRRAIYMTKVRMRQDGVFGAFDCPDAGQVQPRRPRSTTALQALSLFNSRFVLDQAEFFKQRLEREAGQDRSAQVRRAFELCFGRPPDEVEAKESAEFVAKNGLPEFCRAMLNTNEFMFIP